MELLKLSMAIWLMTSATAQSSNWPFQTFYSVPFQPPVLEIIRNGTPAHGYWFFAPLGPAAHQTAPLIFTNDDELVWQGAVGNSAFNFGVQIYQGKPVIAYWNGTIFPEPVGRGYGSVYILDNTYSTIANVTLSGNFVTSEGATFASIVDLHEIFITPQNTILVTANNVTQIDLSSVGGPRSGYIVDGLIYEIDIATNKVLFRWSAVEHLDSIPLNASLYPLGSEGFDGSNTTKAWGYFHVNAVSPYDDGYLISSRYTCSAIAISKTGEVKWRLQGRTGADFHLGAGTNFCYQHDIRAVNSNASHVTLHMHDNANCPIDNGTVPTSGLSLSVDLGSKSVELLQRYQNPLDPTFSTAQGSFQPKPDGHVVLGHGFFPKMEEFDGNGDLVETARFAPGLGALSYRAFRQHWIGCPKSRPDLVTQSTSAGSLIYVSWNGATEITGWKVSYGAQEADLSPLATVTKQGFETSFALGNSTGYVQVQAELRKEAVDICGYYDSGSLQSEIVSLN